MVGLGLVGLGLVVGGLVVGLVVGTALLARPPVTRRQRAREVCTCLESVDPVTGRDRLRANGVVKQSKK